jgi:DNA-binding CsgD family transcriptional regulator/tetratricopeptide (TPR) repeat protein
VAKGQLSRDAPRVTLPSLREAYFRGDFESCLALCDEFAARTAEDVVESTLLRARSLLALNRQDQALELVRGLRLTDRPLDEYLTAQMLIGAAYVALGQTKTGLETLSRAHSAASAAHPTVRAELAVHLAICNSRLKRYDEAERLLAQVPDDADIVSARALEYSAWMAWARHDYSAAVDLFRAALQRLDQCARYDRFIEAKALYGLAFLCSEVPRLDLWPEVRLRASRFNWLVSGLASWRYWFVIEASLATELLGDLDAALHWAALAEEIASSPACRILALCRLAARVGRYGETAGHTYFLGRARAAYDELVRDGHVRDEPSLPLVLAEEFVHGATPEDAAPLLTYYTQCIAPTLEGHADEGRYETNRILVEAHLDETRGERARAERGYVDALARFQGMGLHRRAAVVAYRLAVLTGDVQYHALIAEMLRDASDDFWIKASIATSATRARLSERQLGILRLVSEGKSNKEIAAECGVSFYTARNSVRDLLRLLNVRTRGELSAIAVARGISAR